MNELFRPEAMQHVANPLEGEIIVSTPNYIKILTVASLAVVALAAVGLATAQYPRQETVSGWITPQGGVVRVTGLHPGIIQRLNVEEGQPVAEGQALASIDLLGRTTMGDTSVALAQGVRSQAAAIDARSDAAVSRLMAERVALELSLQDYQQQIAHSIRRAALARQRAELAQQEIERAREIADRGFMSRRDLDQRTTTALVAREEQMEVDAETLRLRRELNASRSRLAALASELATQQAERDTAKADLTQRQAETQAQSVQVVTAPVSGEIAALPVRAGQNVTQETVLAALIPAGAPLEAELFVPSSAAGFVRPGQMIRLLYDAFPHQKFGAAEATIISVSPTVLAPGEIAIPGGGPVGQPVFRVRAALSRNSVLAYGREAPLRAGMTLRANVILERRSLVEWLLDPLYAAGRR